MKSQYSRGCSTARSSALSYASSTLQNNTQSIVMDQARGILVKHLLYAVLPPLFLPFALLLNFLLLVRHTGAINACYVIYIVCFYGLMFGAPCASFSSVNFVQIYRYLDAQQHTPGSVQFTYGIILKTLLCVVLIVFSAFGTQQMGVIESDAQQSAINKVTMLILLIFALFTFAYWDECRNIFLVKHDMLQYYMIYLAVGVFQLTFSYFYFLIAHYYNPVIFCAISCALIAVPLLYTLATHTRYFQPKDTASLLSLDLKSVAPVRWAMIGLNLLRFLEYLLDTIDMPLLYFFVLFFVREQSGNAIDQLEFSLACTYVIVFQMGYAANLGLVQFIMRFVGVNFDYKMNGRIRYLLTKDLLSGVVIAIIYCIILFLVVNPLMPVLIHVFSEQVQLVESYSYVFKALRISAIIPLLGLPYQLTICVLKITGAYRGNLYLILAIPILAVDCLIIGLYSLSYTTQRATDILLYSQAIKFFVGSSGYVWLVRWLKYYNENVQIPEPVREPPQLQEISEVSVRQANNASTSKVESQLYNADTDVESTSFAKIQTKPMEMRFSTGLKYNMTTDFLASQESSK